MNITVGSIFTRLTVVGMPRCSVTTTDFVDVSCSCGKKKKVLVNNLLKGRTRSCGCLHQECQVKNLKNMRFGRLLVVEKSRKSNGHGGVFWRVRCDCGIEKEIASGSLIRGSSKSCGCLQKNVARKGNLPGESTKRALIQGYKRGAKNRNLTWELTAGEFFTLVNSPCHYCGAPPYLRKVQPDFLANGVDRVDSSLGYLIKNVVPCCKFCQFAKRDMSYSDFLAHLKRASEFKIWEKLMP